MVDDLFRRTEHLVQESVECMLKQMLKPFKQAFLLDNFVVLVLHLYFPLLLLLWQYILLDAIQKASQTWGDKRNPGALNGTKKKKKKKKT